MSSFLERVVAERRAEIATRGTAALDEARSAAASAPAPRDLAAALRAPGISLIAELKRASPSAGPIAPDVDRVDLVRAYETGGAAAVSVLTEPLHFRGSLEDLREVRAATGLPVLRKDFIVDPIQVWEARAAGADAVLLIVAALEDATLGSLLEIAREAGVAALVEVHTAAETERAVAAGATIVGINTRDLASLRVDLGVVERIRPHVPAGAVVVGESGIVSREDVVRMADAGCDAVLVGETLMRAADPAAAVRALLGRG